MKLIKVLGSGCKKCIKTAESIERIALEKNIEVTVIKETDVQIIMSYNVTSTPAVVIDEQLVHTGSIPHSDQIIEWLSQ